jgi:glycogen synthase
MNVYLTAPNAWLKMMKAAMMRDFSWRNSARRYSEVYEEVIQACEQAARHGS